jgi:hypothetical protein
MLPPSLPHHLDAKARKLLVAEAQTFLALACLCKPFKTKERMFRRGWRIRYERIHRIW